MEEKLQFVSPVASFANHLLNGDWSQGEQGLLVRTYDKTLANIVNESSLLALLKDHDMPMDLVDPLPPLRYLPSSYLHASIRASGAIYQEYVQDDNPDGDFTILVGTKFANNTSMERFQRNGMKVGCDFIYPVDGTSIERGSILGRDFCWPGRLENVCVEGECLSPGEGSCGMCQVEPSVYGDLLARWVETVNNATLDYVFRTSCFYDTFGEAVTASDSLWKERKRWFTYEHPMSYGGYTECASQLEIKEVEIADAIVLPLHRTSDPLPQTHNQHNDHRLLEKRLMHAQKRGYGDLPVLFYRESMGIKTVEDCERLFKGRGCDDAWRKEFFSAEYFFSSGNSCLYKPPGCEEVYFFPADGNSCSAFTDKGKERIERLCRNEKTHDARVAYEDILLKGTRSKESIDEPSSSTRTSSSNSATISKPSDYRLHSTAPGHILNNQSLRNGHTSRLSAGLDQVVAPPSYYVSSWITQISFFLLGAGMSMFFGRRKMRIQLSEKG